MRTTFYIEHFEFYDGYPIYGTMQVTTDTPDNAVIAFTLLRPELTIRRVTFMTEDHEYEEIAV